MKTMKCLGLILISMMIFSTGVFADAISHDNRIDIVFESDRYAGNENEETPYAIYSIEDLQKIGKDDSWTLDKSYILMNDLDFSGIPTSVYGNFEPIGSEEMPFTGVFDGNGKTIKGLILRSETSYVAFINFLAGENATVKNLGLTDIDFSSGVNASGIVAVNYGCVVENCYVTGVITASNIAAGITVINLGAIVLCNSKCEISGYVYCGGIAGFNSGIVLKCYSKSNLKGVECIGGIVGYSTSNYYTQIARCYSIGEIEGESYVGGIAGSIEVGEISDCYSFANIKGLYFVGGITGAVERKEALVARCYAAGKVYAAGGYIFGAKYDFVGGIAGQSNGTIVGCFALNTSIKTDLGYFYASIVFDYDPESGNTMGILSENRTSVLTFLYVGDTIHLVVNGRGDTKSGKSIMPEEVKLVSTFKEVDWRFANDEYEAWEMSEKYNIPVLLDLEGQDDLVIPLQLI